MRIAAALILLIAGAQARAQQTIGPADVWTDPDLAACTPAPADEAYFTCLAAAGAPAGAVALAKHLAGHPAYQMPGLLIGFTELGAVDAAQVFFPGLANTNQQLLLVNGAARVWPLTGVFGDPPADSVTQGLIAAFPQALPGGRISLTSARGMGEGAQRFVLADEVLDGCRSCAQVGEMLVQLDFIDGVTVAAQPLGWAPLFDPAPREARALQQALNRAGYDAGPPDGIAGPRTAAALAAFRADRCLTEADEDALWQALADPAAAGACAAANPFGDGTFATDPALCDTAGPAFQALGDAAYNRVITFEGDQVDRIEARCTLDRWSEAEGEVTLDALCRVEGAEEPRRWTLIRTGPDGFREGDTEFARCR